MPGLQIKVVENENEGRVLVDEVLNSGGAWSGHALADTDTIVVLLLIDSEGKELIRCRVPITALNPMECFMSSPKEYTEIELHRMWRMKYRELQAKGTAHPDPDAVAREAFVG